MMRTVMLVLVSALSACSAGNEQEDATERHRGSKLDELAAKRGERISPPQREAMLMLCALDHDYYPALRAGSAVAIPTHFNGKPIPEWMRQRMAAIPNGGIAVEGAETTLEVLRAVANGDKGEVDRLHRLFGAFRVRECGRFPPDPSP